MGGRSDWDIIVLIPVDEVKDVSKTLGRNLAKIGFSIGKQAQMIPKFASIQQITYTIAPSSTSRNVSISS
jgi:hypothetical protein